MKILSTFDTNLRKKKVSHLEDRFGKENVFDIKRSKLFRWIKVAGTLLQGILFTTIIGIAVRYAFHSETMVYRGVGIGTVFSSLLYLEAFNKYLDYTMDYCIVTPEEIILTQQEGILKRTVRTLDVAKVKSIYVNKQSLLYSIFDVGTIVFMSDGDEQFGEIVFDYIRDPETQKDEIQRIIEKNNRRKEDI